MSDRYSENPRFNWQAADPYQEYIRFRSHCNCHFDGSLNQKTDKVKIAYLLGYVGDRGREVHSTFIFDAPTGEGENQVIPANILANVWAKFEAYFKPKRSEIRATVKFYRRKQGETENFDSFYTDLELLARDCNFGELKDRMIRDAIVLRSRNPQVMEKCFDEGDELKKDKAVPVSYTHLTLPTICSV